MLWVITVLERRLVWWCGNPPHWFNCTCRICQQQGSHWPSLPPFGSGWFNRLFVTQESGMALVLLLCPPWATSCYRSAPTRLLTHRSLQGVGHASKHSDIKRHGRHTNIRKHTHTELSLSSEQQADISPFFTVPVCVCVCVWWWLSCLWDMLCLAMTFHPGSP